MPALTTYIGTYMHDWVIFRHDFIGNVVDVHFSYVHKVAIWVRFKLDTIHCIFVRGGVAESCPKRKHFPHLSTFRSHIIIAIQLYLCQCAARSCWVYFMFYYLFTSNYTYDNYLVFVLGQDQNHCREIKSFNAPIIPKIETNTQWIIIIIVFKKSHRTLDKSVCVIINMPTECYTAWLYLVKIWWKTFWRIYSDLYIDLYMFQFTNVTYNKLLSLRPI